MTVKEYAEQYNNLGWVVMPITANSKRPFIKNWSKIKSNDETLNKFNDDSNIGIIMGKVSGIMCIDVDVKAADGVTTLNDLEQKYGSLPSTVMSETPSGGIHYYFKYHEGIINRKKVGEGIDIQADGTQTLEEPSTVDGNTYEWVNSPFDTEVAELPDAWIDFLMSKSSAKSSDDSLALSALPFIPPEVTKEGSRNNTLAAYVGSMLGKKLKKKTVLNKALRYNEENCDPPLDEEEVETIVNSMIKTDITNKSSKVIESINENSPDEVSDIPCWLFFDETGAATIDEKKFSEWYVEKYQIHCINGRFFSCNGLIGDGWFENNIHNLIGGIIKTKLAAKVSDLLRVIKNEAYKEVDTPDPYKIQFQNQAFNLKSGKIVPCEDFFTVHQIPHDYDSAADCPQWKRFMKELFFEEDIPVVQEYLGYCLLPNTLAQTSLFITGEGGEGKSRITIMMEHVLGANSVVIGDFKGLQDRFSLSSLDNQMLFIDDDISMDALDDTSNFKKIVTAETMLEVEQKGKPKYKTKLYSKILCCGNGAVTSKFDRSDGFYRRLLICKVKPIKKGRPIDRTLSEKLKEETPGVINWLLEGALRVINNGFVITPSHRMNDQLKELRDNSDTIGLFLNDNQYITYTMDEEDKVSVKQLYDAYETWCQDNSYICIHKNTFGKTVRKIYKCILQSKEDDVQKIADLTSIERVYVDKKQVRGIAGIKINNYRRSFTVGG